MNQKKLKNVNTPMIEKKLNIIKNFPQNKHPVLYGFYSYYQTFYDNLLLPQTSKKFNQNFP